MAGIKPLDQTGAKWKRVAGSAQREYEEGVRNPRKSWATQTAAAESSYNQGVQDAISRGSFGAGVKRAGDAKWQKNAVEKGPQRFSQGVGLAEDAYVNGFEPYHRAIANLSLPPRGPKGDPKNIDRVRAVSETLHDLKISRSR